LRTSEIMEKGTKLFDFYRKIPTDLTEKTLHGGILSILAVFFMGLLFIIELFVFLNPEIETSVMIDPMVDSQLRLNFNISVPQIPCEYATIDIYDVLGENRLNVSKNVEKWALDESGVKRLFQGRNREQQDIKYDEHHPELEVLHANGIHAIPLDQDSFPDYLRGHENVFANFYAPWCIWCQRLAPVWEAFAEEVEKDNLSIQVISIDCVENKDLCTEQQIQAFPTLRLFKNGERFLQDYKMDRKVETLKSFVKEKLDLHERMKEWPAERVEKYHETKYHPGCVLSGFLLVNKVPGHFHIEARSKHHDINAPMTNVSHIVHSLSFGRPLDKKFEKNLQKYVPEHLVQMNFLRGQKFIDDQPHQAHHHYIKVINTHYNFKSNPLTTSRVDTYQYLPQTSVMHYDDQGIPEAKFAYDISPMIVSVKKKGKRWYDFVTSICAIIGGTFTVLGLFNSIFHHVLKKKL